MLASCRVMRVGAKNGAMGVCQVHSKKCAAHTVHGGQHELAAGVAGIKASVPRHGSCITMHVGS